MSVRLPGSEGIVADELRTKLAEAGKRGLRWADRERWGAALDDDALAAGLRRLERAGDAIERDGRWTATAAAGLAVGQIDVLQGGDAIVRTGSGGEPGFFVPQEHLGEGRQDDLVLVEKLERRPAKSGGRRLPEARVAKTLRRGHDRLVGTLAVGEDGRRTLVPFDWRVDLEVEVAVREEIDEDVYVVVEIEPGSAERADIARGRVVEVLGRAEEPGVDVVVALRHHGIPEEFPAAVLAAAERLPPDPQPADWEGREDLRGAVAVTIDGPTARDFDDAVSVDRLPSGGFRLGVHIADVGHYIAEGGVIDREAYRRGTSVYFPERAVPMLPERLSNGLCSLRPDVPRLTLSAFIEVAHDGTIRGRRFAETVIQSRRRLTYDEVRRVVEEPHDTDLEQYGDVLSLLQRLHELEQVLLQARAARGSLDFDLPEGDVVLDTDGVTVGIRPAERNVAHRIIEECMLAANQAVAQELVGAEVPALFRVHDAPNRKRLEELRTTLRPLGYDLQGELENLHPSQLQRLLEQAEGKPEEPFVSALVLRSQQRAIYHPECRGHYALAARYYAHFTSPIRRYPDLVVHRQLRQHLRGQVAVHEEATGLAARLPEMGEHSSDTERRAESAERDVLQWKKVRFLASRVGETFSGTVTGVQPFGLFVMLDGLYVDGLVPVRTMTDDYYVHEPERHQLVGQRSGRRFRLASKLEVRLTAIDPRRRALDLELVEMTAPPRRERSGRRPGEKPRAEREAAPRGRRGGGPSRRRGR